MGRYYIILICLLLTSCVHVDMDNQQDTYSYSEDDEKPLYEPNVKMFEPVYIEYE